MGVREDAIAQMRAELAERNFRASTRPAREPDDGAGVREYFALVAVFLRAAQQGNNDGGERSGAT